MFLRSFLLFVFLAILCEAADHNTFKSCSEINLCNSFREKVPDQTYSADVKGIGLDQDTVFVNLTIDNGKPLLLKVNLLTNGNFRIQIEETDPKRYHLQDVLDGEPEIASISISDQSDSSVQLNGNETKAIIKSLPFSIEFYKNDVQEVVLDGSRLLFDPNSNAFTLKINYPQAVTIYGIHEHADRLALRNTNPGGIDPYRLRNLDTAGFETDSPMALYGSVPVLYGHGTSVTSGIFLHNAAEQWHEIQTSDDSGSSVYMIVESGALDLFVLLGPGPRDVVRQYTSLTGVAGLPQLWALGYHQCRWNYDNDSDVKNVIANLDNNDFPVDVIWLDIEYTDGKRYFTWNLDAFNDPIEMQQNISATNRKLVTIIDPHIKVDENYEVYKGALDKDLFVKYPNGTVFQGDCWPGASSYMDFLNPDAREYYGSYYNYSKFPYTTETLAGIWNDMNEPSVFDDSLEKTLPGDIVHYGGVSHRDIHNIYGLLHTKATHGGLLKRDPEKRPFILSRSHFAGTQRFSAIWTGDNTADWSYLAVGIYECLNANILGIVFCGSDIGGFSGNPTEELLQRWYQAAAWIPFYREHADSGTPRREPYLYSTEVQDVIRMAMRERYAHICVIYTLFFEHYQTGDPIIRPLFYHYPTDPNVIKIDQEFLLGQDILIAPVVESGLDSIDVYFPGQNDSWLEIHSNLRYDGGQSVPINVTIDNIPVFYRVGSIIPIKPYIRRNTEEMKDDPYQFIVNVDEGKFANGTLYIDDYETFDYQSQKYSYYQVSYFNGTLTIETTKNIYEGSLKLEAVRVNTILRDQEQGTYDSVTYKSTADGIGLSSLKFKENNKHEIKLY